MKINFKKGSASASRRRDGFTHTPKFGVTPKGGGFTHTPKFGVTPKGGGFTLIELLVVVAIIGILASVVLASLNTARSKGSDAAIKADMSGVRASAEVQYDTNNNNYGSVAAAGLDCGTTFTMGTIFNNPSISTALAHVRIQNGNVALYCNQDAAGTGYAIVAPLKTTSLFWCIDSTGVAKGTSSTGTDAYTGTSTGAYPALTGTTDLTCN